MTASARAEKTFKVGDQAVYPSVGVAEVISIEEKDFAGSRKQFYVLQAINSATNKVDRLMIPVADAKRYGLRAPISESGVREIFTILKDKNVTFNNETWNRRYRGFQDKIKTGSIFDMAEVVRDLYLLKAEKSLSFGEKNMLERARTLVVKEIAVSRKKTEDKVLAEIEKLFEN